MRIRIVRERRPSADAPGFVPGGPPGDDYRPLTVRRRLLILLLAVATAIGVVLTLLDPPGGVVRKRPTAPPVPECSASAAAAGEAGCVGGKASVIMAPAASR